MNEIALLDSCHHVNIVNYITRWEVLFFSKRLNHFRSYLYAKKIWVCFHFSLILTLSFTKDGDGVLRCRHSETVVGDWDVWRTNRKCCITSNFFILSLNKKKRFLKGWHTCTAWTGFTEVWTWNKILCLMIEDIKSANILLNMNGEVKVGLKFESKLKTDQIFYSWFRTLCWRRRWTFWNGWKVCFFFSIIFFSSF